MFSGIIEEIGQIEKIEIIKGGKKLYISAQKIFDDLNIGDSLSVNGVCLTVTSINKNYFTADAVGETLNKTTLSNINQKTYVNLERAIKYNERIGGHLIQGHVNAKGQIVNFEKLGENYLLEIEIPEYLMKYIIKEGSIAIDGISLTIADLEYNKVRISIIPHTYENTILKYKKKNDLVNIEIDLIAKYIENFINNYLSKNNDLTEELLKKLGY